MRYEVKLVRDNKTEYQTVHAPSAEEATRGLARPGQKVVSVTRVANDYRVAAVWQ
jgi:hypothetical protein